MSSYVCITIRLLTQSFHGTRDGGEPEWPPSPLRVLQSLVAAGAAKSRPGEITLAVRSAIEWLATRTAERPPIIIAPAYFLGTGYQLSVPNNAMDIVAAAWSRGNESNSGDASPAKHRAMKVVRPTHLIDGDSIYYLWIVPEPLHEKVNNHVAALSEVANSIVALGWGIDMAIGNASIIRFTDADALSGERWYPTEGGGEHALRIPIPGSLDVLIRKHKDFLNRVDKDAFMPPQPFNKFSTVVYRRDCEPVGRPFAAFSLLRIDESGFRAFDSTRRALSVAGMLRHTTALAARKSKKAEDWISQFVLGHKESKDNEAHTPVGARRFAYIPIPSIEGRGPDRSRVVGMVRRGVLYCFAENCEDELRWAKQVLSGAELVPDGGGDAVAILSSIAASDSVIRQYVQRSDSWATVTPV